MKKIPRHLPSISSFSLGGAKVCLEATSRPSAAAPDDSAGCDLAVWIPRKGGEFTSFHRDLLECSGEFITFSGGLVEFYGDFMEFYGDLMEFQGGLVELYGDFSWDLPGFTLQ